MHAQAVPGGGDFSSAEVSRNLSQSQLSVNAGALMDESDSYVVGRAHAPVTIVEFLDYYCRYCRRAHPVVEDYVRSNGNVRLIVKEFPILGQRSEEASRFAIATKRLEGDAVHARAFHKLLTFRGEITTPGLAG